METDYQTREGEKQEKQANASPSQTKKGIAISLPRTVIKSHDVPSIVRRHRQLHLLMAHDSELLRVQPAALVVVTALEEGADDVMGSAAVNTHLLHHVRSHGLRGRIKNS